MGISVYLANKLLDHQTGKAAYPAPTVYVAVSSTTPTDDGTGVTEPSGGGYARIATTAADWTTAARKATSNAQDLSFAQASADWAGGANMTHGVLYDAATGGNMLGFGALTTPKNVLSGDTLSIPAGSLDITLT